MVNNVAYFYNKRGKDGKKDPKWRQNQPRGKTIENVAIGKTDPQLSTLELIADKAGIPVWYFLLPLPEELLQDLALNELVEAYISTDDKGRQAIISVSKIVSK